jgi:hypothetical protein
VCCSGSIVVAESLQEKQDHAREEKSIEGRMKEINKVCKASIQFKFDWSTWKDSHDLGGHHAASACNDSADVLVTMCRDALAQEAVAKQLKTIVCLGNSTERSADYKAGTLTVHTGLGVDKGDIRNSTKKALGDGLK